MKFQCSVDIQAPLEKVLALYENVDFLKEWQEGFQSYEHVSGKAGTVGAKSSFHYKHGKNDIILIETIQTKDLPREFTALYEHKHMVNTMTSSFHQIDEKHTRFVMDIEYIRFIGLIPKLMGMLFPAMFRKQSQKWLDRFKEFVENYKEKN